MMRILRTCYDFECRLFQEVNRHFDKKHFNLFFRTITHIGGATFTIAMVLMLIIFGADSIRVAAISAALALAASHLPVFLAKKLYPRKRPYLILEQTKFPSNPLQDHSFPSGHTTAIFSVVIPFVILVPALSFVLIPLGLCVGLSRIYLGLHYPSDVITGVVLGSFSGSISFYLIGGIV